MSDSYNPYLFALASNLCFGISSLYYTEFSRRCSPFWMNWFKASLALCLFTLTVQMSSGFSSIPYSLIAASAASGFLGLCLADILLLRSYTVLGPGRTLLLFGFQPIVFGAFAAIMFSQYLRPVNLMVILILLACLALFAQERYQQTGRFEPKAFAIALCAMLLDASGVLVTRYVFESSPATSALEINAYRALGAVVGFMLLAPFARVRLLSGFLQLTRGERFRVTLVSITGCYLALMLYLYAVKSAHLATLSALSVFGPLSASIAECIAERRRPSWQLIVASCLFILGVSLLFLW